MQYPSPFQPGWLRSLFAFSALVLAAAVVFTATEACAQAASAPQTVIVKMVDKSAGQWRFEPSEVDVRQGDTVRFVLDDVVPHNVEFKKVPQGTKLGDARVGPFLLKKGQTYDVVIDDRFAKGVHEYVCTPHEPMGMKGTITVLSSATPTATK